MLRSCAKVGARSQRPETAAQSVQVRSTLRAVETPSADSQRIFAPGSFRDRVAIVTGGGSGIGLATAIELVRLGARVAICGRTEAKLETAKAELAVSSGSQDAVQSIQCDIREPDQVEAMVRSVIEAFGRIDILINNAG